MKTLRETKVMSRRPNEELRLIEVEPSSPTIGMNEFDLVPVSPTSRAPRHVILEWKNLSASIRSSQQWCIGKMGRSADKHIISNVSGVAFPGSLLGIMGSSGCGKTTLLNALTMRSQSHLTIEGSILVDGRLISPGQMDAISAYVQQEDLFGGLLTVKEQLTFQAFLRMDKKFTRAQKMQRVDEIIRELGLTNCQDTLVGVPGRVQSISGGERRRLAFAAEVLTDPYLMFCDEPTSGLDAVMAENVVGKLRKMAAKGKTVVCTIHQPSSYQYAMFDRILLMAEGRLVFLGTPLEALDFFSRLDYPCPLNYNPADHFIHVLSGINGSREEKNRASIVETFCKSFASSQQGKHPFEKQLPKTGSSIDLTLFDLLENGAKKQVSKCSRFKATIATQLRTVMWRSWLCVARDSTQWKIRTLESLFLGVFYGLIYKDQHLDQLGVYNVNGLITLIVCVMTFQCVFSVIQGACEDLPLFFREHWNGLYRTEVYVICKSIADIPASVIFPLFLGFFPFWMIGTKDWHELFVDCLALLLMGSTSVSFGYLMSSCTSSLSEALALLPFFMCPMVLCGGFFINLRSVPAVVVWFKYVSWFKYGNEALSINHWKDVTHIECNVNNSTCPTDGLVILDIMNFDAGNLNYSLGAMAMLIVGYRIIALIMLSFRAWRRN